LDEEPVKISHDVDTCEENAQAYEPFYISSDTIPAFQERFLGYGFTRSSQVVYLFVADKYVIYNMVSLN
jgi:hypothetical protein